MLRLSLLCRVLVVCCLWVAGCATEPTFRVMSFNVRYATDDGPNSWPLRQGLVVETIRADKPDILGLQEPLASQVDYLRSSLPEFGFVGVGREDGVAAGEFVPIFYRSDRFTLLDQGVFWLSDRPNVAGSVGWDAALPRIATWVRLRFKDAPHRELHVVNVHLDHQGVQARTESAKMLRAYADSLTDHPLVLLGDFNSESDSLPYRLLTEDGGATPGLRDAFTAANVAGSYHGFTGTPSTGRIDWILNSRRLESLDAAVDQRSFDGRYPSDHFPVTATLRLRR